MCPTRRLTALVSAALAACMLAGGASRAAAEDPKTANPSEEARKENVERLEKDIRKFATGGHALEHKDEIRKMIESLGVLGGADAAKACLEALAFEDEDVEKDILKVVEAVKSPKLVPALGALIDHRDYRRRFRFHAAMAHTFAVIADVSALEPLTDLVRSEDATVVAAAADAMASFRAAPHAKRVEPVKRMLEVYETTWNLKQTVKPGEQVAQSVNEKRWDVYGKVMKLALQALTGQADLGTPRQFRDWWNDHKKDTNW